MEKRYEIGGKTYIQKALVLGQISQLTALLGDVSFFTGYGPMGIISALGDKLPRAVAIVLTPEGVPLKSKNISEVEDAVSELDPLITVQVVEDFFICNPVVAIFERLTGMAEKINGMLKIGSNNSA